MVQKNTPNILTNIFHNTAKNIAMAFGHMLRFADAHPLLANTQAWFVPIAK
jgi:hypothetical protein